MINCSFINPVKKRFNVERKNQADAEKKRKKQKREMTQQDDDETQDEKHINHYI